MPGGYRWSLSYCKSLQISNIIFSILANFSYALLQTILILTLIFNLSHRDFFGSTWVGLDFFFPFFILFFLSPGRSAVFPFFFFPGFCFHLAVLLESHFHELTGSHFIVCAYHNFITWIECSV